jgi:predicted transcriptional regulator
MALDGDKLQATLDALHKQLEEAESVDPELAEKLNEVAREIREVLQSQGVDSAEDHTVSQRMGDAAVHFEETHPQLSMTLSRFIDTLGQMGI